jgi:hypothetical protein
MDWMPYVGCRKVTLGIVTGGAEGIGWIVGSHPHDEANGFIGIAPKDGAGATCSGAGAAGQLG